MFDVGSASCAAAIGFFLRGTSGAGPLALAFILGPFSRSSDPVALHEGGSPLIFFQRGFPRADHRRGAVAADFFRARALHKPAREGGDAEELAL